MSSLPTQSYEQRLLDAYEGEILGEAFFELLAQNSDDTVHSAKLQQMAVIERKVASALRPIINRYRLKPNPEVDLRDKGRAEATRHVGTDWAQFNHNLRELLLPFLDDFASLLDAAPHEDRQHIQMLVDHEAALIDFAKSECAQADGQPCLDTFMRRHERLLS